METIIKLEDDENFSDEISEQMHIDCANESKFIQERVLHVDASKNGTVTNFMHDDDYLKRMGTQENIDSNNCKEKVGFPLAEIDIGARKAFNNNVSLNKKTVVHKCNICDKEFGRNWTLSRHMKSHSGEKAYKCNICKKRFTTHWHLVRHSSNRNECKKRHKRKIYDNTFAEKCSLTNHIRENIRANIYMCRFCDEAFISSERLSVHTETHEKGNTYNTYIRVGCPEYFLYASNTWLFHEQLLGLSSFSTISKNKDTVEIKANTSVENGDVCFSKTVDGGSSDEVSEQQHIDCSNGSSFIQERVLHVDASKTGTVTNFKYDDNFLKIMGTQENVDFANNCTEKVNFRLVEIDIGARKDSKSNACLKKKTAVHKCNVCNKEFGRGWTLSRHMKSHNGEKAYKCNICEKSFTTHWHLVRHTSNKYLCKKRHKCKLCDNTFAEKCRITNHMREHIGANEDVCNICDEAFICSESLSLHTETHKEGNPCIRAGSSEYLLHAVGIKATNFDNGECSSKTVTKQDLDCNISDLDLMNSGGGEAFDYSHCLNINTDKDMHKCFVCHKTFSRKSSLSRHMEIHNNTKPFKCAVCPKSFIRNDGLIRHEKKHTTGREIKCNVCDKFVVHMKAHMAVHARGILYICTICDAAFSFKSELIHHAKIHSGGQLYKCDGCSKSFTRRSSLNRHKELHTSVERPYKCTACGKHFRRKWNIVRHLIKHTCQ